MHASAIAARPAVIYWQPQTLALLAEVRALRDRGMSAWGTMDAGPHVKVLTSIEHADTVAAALRPLASDVIVSAPGGPATVTA
jgi:diphosphomevalonate decarboxylase